MPDLSIITPVLNRAAFIPEALASVRAQAFGDVEHIVVDGGSTDGTVEILRDAPEVRWISEPDTGLYDAINKGLRMARGAWIGLLNSDDVYLPGAFAAAAAVLAANPAADSVCGGAVVAAAEAEGTGGRRILFTVDDEDAKRMQADAITIGVPITNARFFRRRFFERTGGFDCRYRLAADRDLFVRARRLGLSAAVVPERVYEYRWHGGSLTLNQDTRYNRTLRDEYLALAAAHLSDRALSPELRGAVGRWFAIESARRLEHLVANRRWTDARAAVVDGFRQAPLWPLALAGEVVRRGLRRLQRRPGGAASGLPSAR